MIASPQVCMHSLALCMVSAGWFCQDPKDQCILQAFPSQVEEKAQYA
jgi:hypothetical protein